MKKTVLLLNPPYKEPIIRDNYCCYTSKSGYLWPPIDLLYLSGLLSGVPHTDVHFIDAVATGESGSDIVKEVRRLRPNFIFTLTGTVSFRQDMELLREVRSFLPRSVMFVLGNTPCFEPKRFLSEFPFVNGIVHNFLDHTVRNIISYRYGRCPTLSFRSKEGITIGRINPKQKNSIIKGIPPPRYDLLSFSAYQTPLTRRRPMTTVLTSFGCPFSCSFCIASRLDYHMRDTEDLKAEFNTIKKHGIKELFFEDSTFNTNAAYLEQVCRLLIKGRYSFSWSTNIHSFRVTPALIKLMKEAGCHTVQLGIESGSAAILKQYAPSKIKQNIAEAVRVCKQAGVRVLGYYIIGFPTETRAEVLDTIRFAKDLDTEFASFSSLTPDYGTKIYQEALKTRAFTDAATAPLSSFDSSDGAILGNPHLSQKEQDDLTRRAYTEFYLRPKKILAFLADTSQLGLYIKNGMFLIFKKIVGKP